MTLTFNLPKNVSNGTFPPQGQQLCQIVLKSMHYCTLLSGQIQTCAWTNGRTDIHRTKIVTTMSRFPASGFDKNGSSQIFTKIDIVKENSMSDMMALVRNGDLVAYYIYFAVSVTHSIANYSPLLARRHDPCCAVRCCSAVFLTEIVIIFGFCPVFDISLE